MDSGAERYLKFHRERYALLLAKAAASLGRAGARPPAILVVAPSHEVRLLHERHPEARIDTLGFLDPRFPAPGRHYEMDLNRCPDAAAHPDLGPYHLIVLAEVIEHLRTSPAAVFRFLAARLAPRGEIIVQTPNAASLAKRWNLLRGRHPFMPLPDEPDSSQHWREYTVAELLAAAAQAGLSAAGVSVDNCYRHEGRRARLYLALCGFAPRRLRDCITLVLRKPG